MTADGLNPDSAKFSVMVTSIIAIGLVIEFLVGELIILNRFSKSTLYTKKVAVKYTYGGKSGSITRLNYVAELNQDGTISNYVVVHPTGLMDDSGKDKLMLMNMVVIDPMGDECILFV